MYFGTHILMIDCRKIIHVDMDCFFAAIEIRDNPVLNNKPVAVGGTPQQRGVLATCNYIARQYGLHSAMSSFKALQLCPKLVLLPVNMQKYKSAAKVLFRIFRQYTALVEPLSLDEAFLDVTNCEYCRGSATLIAQTIKKRIKKELQLTASAGVAPNKFLAKIASAWNKPDGLFVIKPQQVGDFVKRLSVRYLFGVGKVTAQKMQALGINDCADLQQLSLLELTKNFGTFGARLYELCRGIDNAQVDAERTRKSLSVEQTFAADLHTRDEYISHTMELINRLKIRLERFSDLEVVEQFVKIKFGDFKQTTISKNVPRFIEERFVELLLEGCQRRAKTIRLLGVGVRFKAKSYIQQQFDFE